MAAWFSDVLAAAGLPVISVDARHMKAAVSAMPVKSDRIDARNVAFALQAGWYRPVHLKSPEARKLRLLLSSREMLVRTRIDLDNHIRGVLEAFGLKVGKISTGRFEARVWELMDEGDAQIRWVVGTMLAPRAVMSHLALLHRAVLAVARQVCRRLMSAPGVGAITPLAFRTAIDEPERLASPAAVGAHFGLTRASARRARPTTPVTMIECGDMLCEGAARGFSRKFGPSPGSRWPGASD